MGRLVRLVGSGIGLASEAIQHRRAASSSSSSRTPNNGESSRSPSANTPRNYVDDTPPQYVEVPDDQAEQLIASGKAVPAGLDEKKSSAYPGRNDAEFDDERENMHERGIVEENDEEQWELDEALETPLTEERSNDREAVMNPDQIVDEFMRSHPPPAYVYTEGSPVPVRGNLPCPVIIPQRRPRNKKRGFVRAYAPVLEDCGIDQATFLDFLKSFHQSSKNSPWMDVVNIGAAVAGFVPSPIAMGVSIAVQVAVGVAMEVQSRSRTNTFLDRMNNEFFRPRGLYCLIMTYKPESSSRHEVVDISKTIITYSGMGPSQSKFKSTMKNLRVSSGKTYGEFEMPEAAPLIFPAIEEAATKGGAEGQKLKDKMKSGQKFVADYMDRRAQATYAYENPNSVLTSGGKPAFASRYADPNHPASSGSLVALLTGGHVDPRARRDDRRMRRADGRGERRSGGLVRGLVSEVMNAKSGGSSSGYAAQGPRKGLVKRVMQKDVLYLMIVNLPSEEELEVARRAAEEASRE
ncbi:hypothetical protein F5884DRAFT_684961 [Xylogone sp. PMI_703]|nr:hypothetical protein F5884DRAFT_684961 [Xylogone sp. PMI_703]